MKNDLILQTIRLHIALLSAPAVPGNSVLTEAARKLIHHNTMDLIYDLHDLGVLDSIAFRALDTELSIAYVNGGFQ